MNLQIIFRKNKFYNICLLLFFIGLIFYFSYHAINGERGVLAFFKLSQALEKSQHTLDELRAERIHSEHRVNLLRGDSLDLDILDEQTRKLLGFASDDESVYFQTKPPNKLLSE